MFYEHPGIIFSLRCVGKDILYSPFSDEKNENTDSEHVHFVGVPFHLEWENELDDPDAHQRVQGQPVEVSLH